MKDNILPEEKLLRLIRGKKKQDLAIEKKSKPSVYPLAQKYLTFLDLRKLIFLAFIGSLIYLVISLLYPWLGLKRIKLPKLTPGKIVKMEIGQKGEVKPYEFYEKGIENRQIFGQVLGQEAGIPMNVANTDLLKDINLVGIISGENPQAIIEDKKSQKTFYLNEGQFIGEFQLEDIQEGKIILNYKGQRYELYL